METRLLIAGEQVAGEGPGLDVENRYAQTTQTDLLSEETVDPVAPIVPVASLDEAIALANSTRFGLGANVYTRDLEAFQETKHVHIETKIASKSWWDPSGTAA
jgi:acyl-CoA reductase-like NAD-dependent aldehyde dehydrogenase